MFEKISTFLNNATMASCIAIASFLFAGATFYYSYIRAESNLRVVITDIDPSMNNTKMEGEDQISDMSVKIKLLLTNSGNTPSVLAKVLWIIPDEFDSDCKFKKKLEDTYVDSKNFSKDNFRALAFSMEPTIVPSHGIIIAEGNFIFENARRVKENIGKSKKYCLAFVANGEDGERKIKVIPALTLFLRDSLGYSESDELKSLIDLL
ncbi:hypothetical protein AEQ67_18415 [Pseudomonas sp. RIT-PI-q]|uniref:hypothetical protein n=1 Tax=Pseudomonas sp. RIT-PI-q TaxID=1690247 RepID=UPI0006CC41DB|nr:hypothetical protein [Pseudomonas sp. RIT-PI-q]KPG95923.1 hypothetical protein AEQ67_18415 [Pseudomonas sp. RIT-PI-q]